MKDLTIEKINIMAGSYDKLVEQNRELQKENRMLKQLLDKNRQQKNLLTQNEEKPFTNLTKREFEVLSLLSQGLSNKEIAKQLCVELNTVRTYVNHIYLKLEIDAGDKYKSTARVQAALKFLGTSEPMKKLQQELAELNKKPFFPYPLNSGENMDFGEFVLISHAWCSFLNTPQQLGIVEVEYKNSGARKMYIGICNSEPTLEGFKNSVLQIAQYGTKLKE